VTGLLPEHQRKWKQIRHSQWQIWKSLCRDRDFVLETARLRYNLTLQYRKNPGIFEGLFDGGYLVTPSDFKKELEQMSSITDKNLRAILERYLRYAIRFQVYMLLPESSRKLHRLCPFRVGMQRSASMFQARIEDGHLVPVGPYDPDNEPASEAFAIESISVPDALKQMIDPVAPDRPGPPENVANDIIVDGGRDRKKRTFARIRSAKFLLIEDDDPTSPLRTLLELCYSPETITFVQVTGGEIPYFFCVIGENVPIDSVWRQAGVAVKQMQIELYKRERAGRPVKLTALKKGMNILLRGSQFATLKSKDEAASVKRLSAVKHKLQM
jgi:hypothetical protein